MQTDHETQVKLSTSDVCNVYLENEIIWNAAEQAYQIVTSLLPLCLLGDFTTVKMETNQYYMFIEVLSKKTIVMNWKSKCF